MIRYAAALAATAMIAAPAMAANVQIHPTGPVVELTVTRQVEGTPDMVGLSAGVTTRAKSAEQAMQDNATQMTSVIHAIEALGIARKDIQTTGIALNPQYEYDQQSRKQVFRGYQVSNRVTIKLHAIKRAGQVLDALVKAGATDLGGLDFGLENDTAAKDQARKAAIAAAHERAMEYARAAGYSGVKLLEVSENDSTARPSPMIRMAAVANSASPSTPVRPGQVQTAVTIHVTYEMTADHR